MSDSSRLQHVAVQCLVFTSGAAALSWESLWQLKSSLSIGVSAKGTAITLAATMGGMTLGALLMGLFLRAREVERPLRIYGLLEGAIGISGLFLLTLFARLEQLDAAIYPDYPHLVSWLHVGGIFLIIGPAAMAMGATIPILGLVARCFNMSLSVLYAMNTAGAALGILCMSFYLLPAIGVAQAVIVLAAVNLGVALVGLLWRASPASRAPAAAAREPPSDSGSRVKGAALVVFATGLVVFTLEVAWFRSLRAAFQSTSDMFALMLASVLIALAIGARIVGPLRRRRTNLGVAVALGGTLALLTTPLVERVYLVQMPSASHIAVMAKCFGLCLVTMAPPIVLIGTALPWILDDETEPRRWGRLYGLNTLGAIVGAMAAAWLLLPTLGFQTTSLIAGAILVGVGVTLLRGKTRIVLGAAGAAALVLGVSTRSEVGTTRVQSARAESSKSYKLLAFSEGPDATSAVVEYASGYRALIIDGFQAASVNKASNYMEWMGRLPMILHPKPNRALVICFGTGQTAHGVRAEAPGALDVVDVNPAVFEFAPLFSNNRGVLDDARVESIVMDGRAWLRRTDRRYDVATLEPMPPHFAGVNALYSLEFYQIVARRLNPGAMVAQWVPFHLLPPTDAASVVRTFVEVFPDSLLWLDPVSGTGVVVGRYGTRTADLGSVWPGLGRLAHGRNLTPKQIAVGVVLGARLIRRYAAYGRVITDDNQLLAYGGIRTRQWKFGSKMQPASHKLIRSIRGAARPPRP